MTGTTRIAPILNTKLYRPPVTEDYLARPALENRLEMGASLPLTVVSAPAGYGKSTLVSRWLETSKFPNCWLSLDESDSDIRVFLNYFVAALRTASPGAFGRTLDLIISESLPPLSVVATQLSNDLDILEQRAILVLDDYYRLQEPAVHDLLHLLLKHPARKLHLVIVSRRDPPLSLTPLRARHLLTEIRLQDLQFSSEETLSFVSRSVGNPLNPNAIEQLQNITEGWLTGIRLTLLALQNQKDVEGFLSRIDADARPFQEYLVEEVLSEQPPLVRDCLLKTSILHRFNASLCEAVWTEEGFDGEAPIAGEDFIRTLENSGLFCVSLDGRRDWFRFHHLFANLLDQQLEKTVKKEEISRLHRRASRWLADNGQIEEALRHALAGNDEEGAAGIVESARHALMNKDEWHRLERWLRVFSYQSIQQLPQLMVLRCWLDLSYWYRLDDLAEDIDRTETLLASSVVETEASELLKKEAAVIRGALAYWTINPSLAATLTDQAIRDLPLDREYARSVALMYRGGAHQLAGEIQQADSLLKGRIGQDASIGAGSRARILQALCFVHWCEADTRKLWQATSRLLTVSLENDLAWSHSFARYFIGLVHYERNELTEAVTHCEIVVNEPYRYPIQNVTHCSFLLSLSYQALGMPEQAREIADTINRFTLERGNRMFIDLAEAFQVDLDLRQGRLAQATQWARNYKTPIGHVLHRFFNAEFVLIRALIARNSEQGMRSASAQLNALDALMRRSHHNRLLIDLLGIKALMADREGNPESAVALLQEAILLGQPGQLLRPLADLGSGLVKLLNRLDLDQQALKYVGLILSAMQHPGESTGNQPESPSLPEALSQRELEILDLFAQDLSNKEIAETLFIAPGTVKRHAQNIFSKLAVRRRQDAVSKAIGLGILKGR